LGLKPQKVCGHKSLFLGLEENMRSIGALLFMVFVFSSGVEAFSGKKASKTEENQSVSEQTSRSSDPRNSQNGAPEDRSKKKKFWFSEFSDKNSKKLKACSQDSDCVLVQSSVPCPCSSGGSNQAINRDFESQWVELRQKKLKAFSKEMFMCAEVYKCAGSAKCISGKCFTASGSKNDNDSDETLIIRKRRKRR
jgi:hypothetical protein